MRLSFKEHSIEIQTWQTISQLKGFLSECEAGNVLLGEQRQQGSEFYSATIYLSYSGKLRFGIGICSEGYGVPPNLLLDPAASRLIFGFNMSVVEVDVPSGTISFSMDLDSPFYSFQMLYDRDLLLVIHEIGVIALTKERKLLWKFSRDVITNITIEGERLHLEFMDEPSIWLNRSDGGIAL